MLYSKDYFRSPIEEKPEKDASSSSLAVFLKGKNLYILKAAARSDEKKHICYDLSEFWLPETPFNSKPSRLTDRPDLVDAILEGLQSYSARNPTRSKSSHLLMGSILRSMVRFIEYGFLHGVFRLCDWHKELADQLITELGSGGWARALQIQRRTEHLCNTTSENELRELISINKSKSRTHHSLKIKFGELVGTSCKELRGATQTITRKINLPPPTSKSETLNSKKKNSELFGMSASQLRSDISFINIFSDITSPDIGLSFVPYADTIQLSNLYGRGGKRTSNLSPEDIAKILKESFWWVKTAAPLLIYLCNRMTEVKVASKKHEMPIDSGDLMRWIRRFPETSKLEELIGTKFTSLALRGNANEYSFMRALYCLETACFIIIAFLNARRRDELVHRKVGLHRLSLRPINKSLHLYECDFYIEKTYQSYIPYYVGQHTADAIAVLEELSDNARLIRGYRPRHGQPEFTYEDKLFEIPRLTESNAHGGVRWFKFTTNREGLARDLLDRALGIGTSVITHPHMFRRAYALISHYRYENSSLQALAQQLGHFDLATIRIYVTDVKGGISKGTASSYARNSQMFKEAHEKFLHEIDEELSTVSTERLLNLSVSIIEGETENHGGLAKLIQRFHQILGRRIEYSALDKAKQADYLTQAMATRGHKFNAMPHSNCVAPSSSHGQSAACYSKESKRVSPENARPSLCFHCPYSHFVDQHLSMWEHEVERLKQDAATWGERSVKGAGARIELIELQNMIAQVRKRTS